MLVGYNFTFHVTERAVTPEDWNLRYRVASSWPQRVDPSDYLVVFSKATNPQGLKSMRNASTPFLDRYVNLTIVNSTFFQINAAPFPSYSTVEDEEMQILLKTSFFYSQARCRPAFPVDIAIVTLIAIPDAVAKATQTAVAVVTSAAVGTSMAGGASAAGDAQSLALLALMSCAQPVEKQMTKNTRLLSPLALDDSLQGMVLGNFILICLVIFLQWSAVFIVKKVKKMKHLEVANLLRFPQLSLLVCVLTHQGTGAASIQLVTLGSPTPAELVFGSIGAAYCLFLPIFMFILAKRHVNAEFIQYRFDEFTDGDCNGKGALMKKIRVILPRGRWEPPEMRKTYGPVFSGLGRQEIVWSTSATWAGTLMIILTSFRPPTTSGCIVQFVAIALAQLLMVCIIIIFRPYRAHFTNFLAALSALCLATVFGASAVLADDPNSPKAKWLTFAAVQTQLGVTVLRILYIGFVLLMERHFLIAAPKSTLWAWKGSRTSRKRVPEIGDEEFSDDESMEPVGGAFHEVLVMPDSQPALPLQDDATRKKAVPAGDENAYLERNVSFSIRPAEVGSTGSSNDPIVLASPSSRPWREDPDDDDDPFELDAAFSSILDPTPAAFSVPEHMTNADELWSDPFSGVEAPHALRMLRETAERYRAEEDEILALKASASPRALHLSRSQMSTSGAASRSPQPVNQIGNGGETPPPALLPPIPMLPPVVGAPLAASTSDSSSLSNEHRPPKPSEEDSPLDQALIDLL